MQGTGAKEMVGDHNGYLKPTQSPPVRVPSLMAVNILEDTPQEVNGPDKSHYSELRGKMF